MKRQINRFVWALAACLGPVILSSCQSVRSRLPADFWVLADGDDRNPGTLAAPFASVERAQKAVRELRGNEPTRTSPVVVRIGKGTFWLTEPLQFTPQDSGSGESPVIYEGEGQGKTIFSGGVRLTGWEVRDGRWTVTLSAVREGRWRFSQLFVNGQRRFRPRVPSEGYYYIRGAVPSVNKGPKQRGHNRFAFKLGQLQADWRDLHAVEMLVFHSWSMSRIPVQAVDESSGVVTLAGFTWNDRIAKLGVGRRFIAENVFEALDEPGEWYLDRNSGELTYIPMPGETPRKCVVVAPRLDAVVEFRGDLDAGLPVAHVVLREMGFKHTNWNVPVAGYCVPQSEVGNRSTHGESAFSAAVSARHASCCRVERCAVAHTGYYGVEFGEACRDNALVDCELWDLGAGGVMLGTTRKYGIDDDRTARRQIVRDCMVAHGGRMHPAGCGVWIGHSPDNKVLHNDVFDFYYTAISVGWTWNYGVSPAKINLISRNHLYDIGQTRLSDLGGIYTLGASEGTVLSFNRIHDISRDRYGGSGIYFDQGSSGILVENNVVYNTQDATFTVHWGRDDIVRNNIFAFGESFQIGIGRPDKSEAMRIERNIVVWRESNATSGRHPRDDWGVDRNLYWCYGGETDGFEGKLTFEQWQAQGKDLNSIVADPKFRNPEELDFRLVSDSPALALGFVPFALDDIGRRTRTRRSRRSSPVPHAYPPAAGRPPMVIEEGFEAYAPGSPPMMVRIHKNNENETVRVTDVRAATGSKSLEVIDGPGPGAAYNPHFYYAPGYRKGTVRGQFAVFFDKRSPLGHAWRNLWRQNNVTWPLRRGSPRTLLARPRRSRHG